MSSEPRLIHVEHMRLRWGEMDLMHHLNNVAYFRYFEEARIGWFRSLGHDGTAGRDGPVLGSISCRFERPAIYPADVVIELRAGRVGTASFTVSQIMRDAADPEVVYARGEATMVWTDAVTGRSAPLPPDFRQVLEG